VLSVFFSLTNRCAYELILYALSRLGDDFAKVQWFSTGTEKFAVPRNRGDLPHKTVAELRELDPWETEVYPPFH
jgi:hypothetical protein